VAVYSDFSSLLAAHGDRLDLVSIVSPMLFHAEQHRACVERGIACYLEKPPTLDPGELEQMIAVETRARFATQVGFNYISQPWRQALKKRLIAGEFGPLRRVGFKGLWRRSQAYFGRNTWAGSLLIEDSIITDSCCGNAMAHFLHNMLFHAGTENLMSWAAPQSVQAELYRANRIEGADTVFAKGVLDNGVEFHLAATHACEPYMSHVELIQCDRAEIEIREEGPFTIRYTDGTIEIGVAPPGSLRENLQKYREYLVGKQRRPATLLEDCRAFVELNALLYIAAGKIQKLRPPHAVACRVEGDPKDTFCIPGIGQVCEEFLRSGKFPSQLELPWGASGGRASITQVPELRKVLSEIRDIGSFGRARQASDDCEALAVLKD
jgi:predicted dehydrogenase